MQSHGTVYRPCYKDRKGVKRESAVYWLRFTHGGRLIRESTGTRDLEEARAKLEEKVAAFIDTPPDATLGALSRILIEDYRANGYRSERRITHALDNVLAYFGKSKPVSELTGRDLARYISARLAEGRARATVNRETGALARAFALAREQGMLAETPRIPKLREDNARHGFVEREQFEAIISHLAPHLCPPFKVAYITGWRFYSEVLTRQWQHVDDKWLRLDPGEAKTREPRLFPLVPELREAIGERTQVGGGYLFHKNGARIREPKNAWRKATEAAGCPGVLIHDLRRSAARNMVRAGVPALVVMRLCGWKSEAMLRRYCIVEESMLAEAGEKLAAWGVKQKGREGSSGGMGGGF